MDEEAIRRLAEAAHDGDAEAALQIAMYALGFKDSRSAADAWLREAARLGGVPMMWRITALATECCFPRRAAQWQRAAIAAEWSGADVEVDEESFRLFDDPINQDFRVRVRGATDYSPNWVSEPAAHPDGGWAISVDCKGEAIPLMARAFLRILVEEVRKAGVTAGRIGPTV